MQSTLRVNSSGRLTRRIGVLAACILAGCSTAGPGVNMFKDDSIPESEWTTPSAEGVAAAAPVPTLRQRDWPPEVARIEPTGVPHWPLWWEDPFEDKGSIDAPFVWSYEDYIAMPYSVGRFLLNTMGWPVSAVVTPPWTVMNSDGYLSRQALGFDHDARKARSWPVGGEPPDVETTTQPAGAE